jgi:hypothetical protein
MQPFNFFRVICLALFGLALAVEGQSLVFAAKQAPPKTGSVLRDKDMKYQPCFQPGVNTPSFVYEEGAQTFPTRVTNPYRANYGQAIVIRVLWDPIYQRDLSRAIKQFGERYAGDPNIANYDD